MQAGFPHKRGDVRAAQPDRVLLLTGVQGKRSSRGPSLSSGEGLLVARSLCAQAAGDELLVSYGELPDVTFGLVPP